jgi:cytidylate kinase
MIVLLGGPAGAGKSTVGVQWRSQRPRAAMVVLDAVLRLVMEHHVRRQHAATGRWPDDIVVDSSGRTVEQTCARVDAMLSRYSVRS